MAFPGRSKILAVPYFAQPTGTTCQGTVLKMFASWLEQKTGYSISAQRLAPEDVKTTINSAAGRPEPNAVNSHANMRWWLEQQFPSLIANKLSTPVVSDATAFFVRQLDANYPVLCSVTHANNNTGHIVLVVGYENYRENMSSFDFQLVVHDPYGAYEPSLQSTLYGQKRWSGGMSLLSGGESAPGKNVRLTLQGASRQFSGAHSYGQWLLSSILIG
jgi:hypothetical protein